MAEQRKTRADWSEPDFLPHREKMMKSLKGFKQGSLPSNKLTQRGYSDKTEIDPFIQYDEAREGY